MNACSTYAPAPIKVGWLADAIRFGRRRMVFRTKNEGQGRHRRRRRRQNGALRRRFRYGILHGRVFCSVFL